MEKRFGFYWMMEGVCNEYVRAVVSTGMFSKLSDLKRRRISEKYDEIVQHMCKGVRYGFIDQSQYDEYLRVLETARRNTYKWVYDFENARLGEEEYEIQYTMHQLNCGRVEAIETLKTYKF